MPGPCRPGVRPGRTSAQLRLGMHGHGLTHVLRELPAVGREGVAEAWVGDIHVPEPGERLGAGSGAAPAGDRKSTRLNSSHVAISYAVFCLKKKRKEKKEHK